MVALLLQNNTNSLKLIYSKFIIIYIINKCFYDTLIFLKDDYMVKWLVLFWFYNLKLKIIQIDIFLMNCTIDF